MLADRENGIVNCQEWIKPSGKEPTKGGRN